MEQRTCVRVPAITSIETALRLYYSKTELHNCDIIELFGKISTGLIVKLKNAARDVMNTEDIPNWNPVAVNTAAAYKAWGLDIVTLERNFARLKKLGLIAEGGV